MKLKTKKKKKRKKLKEKKNLTTIKYPILCAWLIWSSLTSNILENLGF